LAGLLVGVVAVCDSCSSRAASAILAGMMPPLALALINVST